MTPSSKSEPELETQPTKSEPDENTPSTAKETGVDATVEPESPAETTPAATETEEPIKTAEPVAETVAVPKDEAVIAAKDSAAETVAVPKDEAAETVAVPKDEAVAETVAVPKDEAVAETVVVPQDETVLPDESAAPAVAATPAETVPAAEPKAEPVAEAQPGLGTAPDLGKAQPPVSFGIPSDPAPAPAAPEAEVLGDAEEYEDDEPLEPAPSNGYPTLVPLIGALLGLTAVAALMLVAFVLPAIKSNPNLVPIGVSGTAEFQTEVKQVLSQDELTPFKVTGYDKESELRAAIQDREVYGGLALGETAISMLVSSGGSPIAAQTLTSLANSLAQAGAIPVTDLAPLPASDPRGDGLAAANLPLVIGAILPALILIPLYRRRTAAQVGVTVGASVLIGLGLSAVLSYLLGSTEDSNFLLVAVGLMLGVLATSLVLLGLFAVAGRIAAGIGAAFLVLFAAPLSGLSSAPEWLPDPWGTIGQFLPPGANATLLRSTAYFDGSGGFQSVLVLGGWALVGLVLIGVGLLLQRRQAPAPLAEEPTDQDLVIEPTPA